MPPAICAISSPGLTLPWLHRRSSWPQVKCVPLQRVQCTPNANNTEILLRGKTSTDIVKLLLPDEEPSATSDAASDGTIDTTAEPIESEPEPEPLKLKPLPYAFNALEPYMSKDTVQYHWERHQQSHVDSLNEHIKGTAFAGMELKDIMLGSYNEGNPLPFFPDAAQVWNHEFFWESMKPRGGGTLSGILKYLIKRDFGSLAGLTREMQKAALTQFGSGWVWLAFKVHRLGVGNDINPRPSDKDKKLVVVKTPNAVNPLVWGYYPLIAIDVWEHAYYMDYENRRGDYMSVFMKNLVSWDMVSSRLDNALKAAAKREKFEKKKLLWKKMHEQTPQVSSLSLRPETAKRPKRRRG